MSSKTPPRPKISIRSALEQRLSALKRSFRKADNFIRCGVSDLEALVEVCVLKHRAEVCELADLRKSICVFQSRMDLVRVLLEVSNDTEGKAIGLNHLRNTVAYVERELISICNDYRSFTHEQRNLYGPLATA